MIEPAAVAAMAIDADAAEALQAKWHVAVPGPLSAADAELVRRFNAREPMSWEDMQIVRVIEERGRSAPDAAAAGEGRQIAAALQ